MCDICERIQAERREGVLDSEGDAVYLYPLKYHKLWLVWDV